MMKNDLNARLLQERNLSRKDMIDKNHEHGVFPFIGEMGGNFNFPTVSVDHFHFDRFRVGLTLPTG